MLWLALLVTLHILWVWITAVRRGVSARRRQPTETTVQPAAWPFVSVIVPAWCEGGTLEHCLNSLHALDYPHWEAIIVAGGPDGTYETARAICADWEFFRVLVQSPRGKNAALNQGITLTSGEVLVLLDADSRMSPNWLKALVAQLTADQPVACGDFLPLYETPISLGLRMEQIAARGIEHYTGLQGGGGIALRREIIDLVGKLPEDVSVGVDWDLNARLAMLKIERIFCPQAVLQTEISTTLRDYFRTEIRWRRAHLNSLVRHSSFFMPNLLALTKSLYIYFLTWFIVLTGLGAGVILIFGPHEIRLMAPILWVSLVAWLLLRRAALAGAVAAYTNQLRWLKLVWAPALLLGATLMAIIPATLTLKKSQAHFKGPRHTRST